MRRTLLTLTAAVALLAASGPDVFAQKAFSRGPATNARFSASPSVSRGGPGAFDGGRRGDYGGGAHMMGPGFTVIDPGRPATIDDRGPQGPAPRRAVSRSATTTAANERRLVPDEVLIEVANSVSDQTINALQRRHRLTRLESQRFQLAGSTLYRWRIPDRRSVANVVRELQTETVVASVQPNYRFTLQ